MTEITKLPCTIGDPRNVDPAKCTAGEYLVNGKPIPGCKFIKRIKIPLNQILSQSVPENHVRVNGITEPYSKRLCDSFLRGIDYTQHPPVVKLFNTKVDGVNYKWKLVTGFNRMAGLLLAGLSEWIFDVYEFEDEYCELVFKSHENNHSPQQDATNEDIAQTIFKLAEVGIIEDNKEGYRNFIKTYHNNAKEVTKIVNMVAGRREISDCWIFNIKQAIDHLNKVFKFNITGNNWSKLLKKYVKVVKCNQTDVGRAIFSAITNFYKDKKQTSLFFSTEGSTCERTLNEERMLGLELLRSIETALPAAVNYYKFKGYWPWNVEGFIPQDKATENLNEIVTMEQFEKVFSLEQTKKSA